MKTNALRRKPTEDLEHAIDDFADRDGVKRGLPPHIDSRATGSIAIPLRMYTEEEVADILQISLSQLRKWRMKQNAGRQQGPRFKKVGRLVRYPQRALQTYIDGD